ncbi:hypothetical protein DB88DRAFT_470075 [Papiliotrema laurentii]|uniref:Uncharacterized protein n=1 Tax=Papiliotrema laurentii TaxID=5418 RepID=A0AAD9L9K4_PAPLA|nr:hypothetical protein DB88DRAFT_470075 [Papiliotrema laurentii]
MPNVETFLSMSLSPERAKGKEYKPMPYTSSRSKGSLFGLVLFARAYGDLHVRASPTSAQDQDLPPAPSVVLASWSGEKSRGFWAGSSRLASGARYDSVNHSTDSHPFATRSHFSILSPAFQATAPGNTACISCLFRRAASAAQPCYTSSTPRSDPPRTCPNLPAKSRCETTRCHLHPRTKCGREDCSRAVLSRETNQTISRPSMPPNPPGIFMPTDAIKSRSSGGLARRSTRSASMGAGVLCSTRLGSGRCGSVGIAATAGGSVWHLLHSERAPLPSVCVWPLPTKLPSFDE